LGQYRGEVTSPKIFNKQNKFDEDGLFSESIFGPIKDFTCKCGKLSVKVLDQGNICDKCGVMCISNESRLSTFGKINLIFPVIKPTKRTKYFKKIVGTHKHLLNPRRADATAATSRFLALSGDTTKLKIVDSINKINGWYIIPLRITGIYSFILCLKYLADYMHIAVAQELFDKGYIMDTIKVLPPEVRPVIRDPNKPESFRYTEVNKPYISLVQLNKSNASTRSVKDDKEEDWLLRINKSMKEQLDDEIVEQMIQEYDRMTAKYQYYVDKVYEKVFENISGKWGLIRSSVLGKTIEFSARSVITINPSLPPYKIKVSKEILYKLWLPYFANYIQEKHPEYTYLQIYHTVVTQEYKDNKQLFDEFVEYFTAEDVPQEKLLATTIVRMKKINIEEEDE